MYKRKKNWAEDGIYGSSFILDWLESMFCFYFLRSFFMVAALGMWRLIQGHKFAVVVHRSYP